MEQKPTAIKKQVTAVLPKRLNAKYIGRVAEHGYIPNKEYVIYLKSNTLWKCDGTARVKYPSVEAFIEDWEIIKVREFKKKETNDTV